MLKIRGLSVFLAVAIICLTASYSITYTAIQSFSSDEAGGNSDALLYISMYKSQNIHGHWRYRILTPYLAKSIPLLPAGLFERNRTVDDFWITKVKFGIVNFIFLCATGILLFYFLSALKVTAWEGLLGVLLFYTARPVIQNSGVPMAEASLHFFTILIFYAIIKEDVFLIIFGFLVGIFSKETLLILALPAAVLSGSKKRLKMALALVPGVAAYLTFRFFIMPEESDSLFYLKPMAMVWHDLLTYMRFSKAADLLSSFGLLWFPAIYALTTTNLPRLLKRWSWIILLLLIIIFAAHLDLGRVFFSVFPIVIPLALYGIRAMLDNNITSDKAHPA